MIEKEFDSCNPRGTLYGHYRGYVVDDEDPRDIGRIKVRIPGIYREDVLDELLPWAIPALGLYRSGGDNLDPQKSTELKAEELKKAFNKTGTGGIFTVPARGNHVWIFFDNGNHMNPVYFATCPGENDFLTQKQYLKDKIDNKLKQIQKIRDKFKPETAEIKTTNSWVLGSSVNVRQKISTDKQKAPYKKGDGDASKNFDNSSDQIQGGEYKTRKLHIDNADDNGDSSKNMDDAKERQWSNFITLDIKPLFDKEKNDKNEDKKKNSPHKYDKDFKLEKGEDTKRNTNRYITSFTTQNGVTEIYDNREEQENYYFIHKNYIENIDEEGSRKVFVGQNEPDDGKLVRHALKDDDRNKGIDKDIRSNDELLVAGDKKKHVLGNEVIYVKGNIFSQVDKNYQIDVNDSVGLRIKKGDFDIIINGDADNSRDDESKREDGNSVQSGDLIIDIQNGCLDVHVKKNCNVYIEGDVNLQINGKVNQKIDGDYSLEVGGDFNLKVDGTFSQGVSGYALETTNDYNLKIGKDSIVSVEEKDSKKVNGNKVEDIVGKYIVTVPKMSLSGNLELDGTIQVTGDVKNSSASLGSHQHSVTTSANGGTVTSGTGTGGGATATPDSDTVEDPTVSVNTETPSRSNPNKT